VEQVELVFLQLFLDLLFFMLAAAAEAEVQYTEPLLVLVVMAVVPQVETQQVQLLESAEDLMEWQTVAGVAAALVKE
jgi:hypothetical protein